MKRFLALLTGKYRRLLLQARGDETNLHAGRLLKGITQMHRSALLEVECDCECAGTITTSYGESSTHLFDLFNL